jgi:hypothetical protein
MRSLFLIGFALALSPRALATADVSVEVEKAFSEYWTVLSVSLEDFFQPENTLLQLRFFEGKKPSAEQTSKKRTEVFALSEGLVLDLKMKLGGKSAKTQREVIDERWAYFSAISLWAASGNDGKQQLELYKAHDRFLTQLLEARAKLEEEKNHSEPLKTATNTSGSP